MLPYLALYKPVPFWTNVKFDFNKSEKYPLKFVKSKICQTIKFVTFMTEIRNVHGSDKFIL